MEYIDLEEAESNINYILKLLYEVLPDKDCLARELDLKLIAEYEQKLCNIKRSKLKLIK